MACETLVTTGMAIIAGEITTNAYVEMPQIVRDTIRDIGYSSSKMGFDWQTCAVMTSIDQQSRTSPRAWTRATACTRSRAPATRG